MTVNAVEVARLFLANEANADYDKEKAAMAKVVLAAKERVKHEHSVNCEALDPDWDYNQIVGAPCTCGHEALVATLEGKP